MNTRTLDVALRVAADLSNAAQELATLAAKLEGLQGAGQSAAQGLDASANAAGKNSTATQSSATAAKAAANAQTALANAAKNTAQVQQKAAISAAQHAQAMRQLPMQVTDIVTGLASGQSVFMVAIQQGGQLKDSFGGAAPAARALLGSISPLAVGVAAGAAAFGLLGKALFDAYEEQRQFTAALLETGNYANISVASIDAMADALTALEGVGQGTARDALLQVAQSGRIASDQFDLVAATAARMSVATGQSIDTTVKKFEEIAKSPVDALLKLNETEHFLTSAQLDRVQALMDEGREQDAAAEGARIYAGRLDEIANAAMAARPHLAKMWDDAKKGASDAWEGTKNFAEFLAASAEKMNAMPWYRRAGPLAGIGFVQSLYSAEPARPAEVPQVAGAVDSGEEKRKRDEQKKREQEHQQFAAAESRYLSDAARKTKELADVQDLLNRKVISGEEASKRKAQIEDSYARKAERAKKKPGKTEAQQDEDAAQREIDSLTKQIYLLAQLSEGERRASHEAQARYEIEQGAYVHASKAAKTKLMAEAKQLDAMEQERKKTEEATKAKEDAQKAYDRLRDSLETPIESAMADVKKGVDVLNDALAHGRINADQYKDALDRLLKKSETKAPELPGQFRQMGGPLGDGMDLAAYGQQLDQWRQDEIQKNDAHLAAKERSEVGHQQRMEEIRTQYDQRQKEYSQAQSQFMLGTASSLFGSLAEIARNGAGEQSKTYRALFALSQGFAVAQALIAVYQNASEASKKAGGYPYNIPIIAGAIAQGLAIVAQIRSVQPSGYATGGHIRGPGSGTSDDVLIWASNGEHMIRERSASQPGARGFLDDFNSRGMPAIYDWARLGKYAEGGQITAMPEPSFRPSAPGVSPVNMQNDMSVYVLNDRAQLVEYLTKHPKMRQAIVLEASENGGAIRASWGG